MSGAGPDDACVRTAGADPEQSRLVDRPPSSGQTANPFPKEEPIVVLGVALLALGVLSAFVLVDLVRVSSLTSNVDMSVLGVSFGIRTAEEIMIFAVGLAVVTTALLFVGSMTLWAWRRRRRSKRLEDLRVRAARLETTERLLQQRVELLLSRVRELEQRKAALGGEREPEHAAPAQVGNGVVLPDLPLPPRDPGSPQRAGSSRLDEGGRVR
jgi:hypothetical protein